VIGERREIHVSSIVVCGGSVIGLSVASMLSQDGHDVTVLEADADDAPASADDAWSSWSRRGVAQFHQPHSLFPRFRAITEAELPGLMGQLESSGCVWVDLLEAPPPVVAAAGPRPGDERFRFVTGRRPVIESAVAAYSRQQSGLTLRRGVRVAGLLTGATVLAHTAHVVGVRTTEGEEILADLVVDAMGRRSPSVAWLSELGGTPQVESADRGFVYYTRYFAGPSRPIRRAPGLTPIGSFSILTLLGDNDTWSVTMFGPIRDVPLKSLRDPGVFNRVVAACPLQAHWLDGDPITDVLPMAGVVDSYRRFVVDGQPVVTGFAAVGDAWACTNPSAGRGLSVGIIHAQSLRRVVRRYLDQPGELSLAWDAETEEHAAPWYWSQINADQARFAEMTACREGTAPPAPDPTMARFMTAVGTDPDVFRGLIEIVGCLAHPREVLERPEIQAALARVDLGDGMPAFPGPDRGHLLELLST
jgi:2-polyprenyl-6-methoxyphenol hydroxylase-like FAD-dependent oxidoreductase